jgi:CRP-like cAMP-binding protein
MAKQTKTEAFFKENGKIQQIPKGSILYQEGTDPDYVFYVQEGSFDLSRRDDDGKEQKVGSKKKGSLVGETAALDGKRRTVSVKATVDSSVLRVGRKLFTDSLRKNAGFCYEVAVDIALTLRASSNKA